MSFFKTLKGKVQKAKNDFRNAQEVKKIDSMFNQIDEIINKLESTSPKLIAQAGKAKEFYQPLSNIITGAEYSIYSSAITSFLDTMELRKEGHEISNKEWELINPLITKYRSSTNSKTPILRGEYEEFLTDIEKFSHENQKDASVKITEIHRKIEEILKLKQAEEQLEKAQRRIEKYLQKIGQEEKFLIETNFSILSPYEFEEYVAKLFKVMGYQTTVTPKTGDFGVDVIATKSNEKIAIQVKKYSEGNKVGNDAVQKLLGAMQQKNIKANKGILITTSNFTAQAREQAEGTPVELWNKTILHEKIRKHTIESSIK